MGSIPESERSPGVGHRNPLQYSCLENPMDRETWRASVHGVAKSRSHWSDWAYTHALWFQSLCSPCYATACVSQDFQGKNFRASSGQNFKTFALNRFPLSRIPISLLYTLKKSLWVWSITSKKIPLVDDSWNYGHSAFYESTKSLSPLTAVRRAQTKGF